MKRKPKRDRQEYLHSGDHLPQPLKDFHDQKRVFKAIPFLFGTTQGQPGHVNWSDAQVYVLDRFLWFMAMHGWTLQQCRANVDFRSLRETIGEMEEEEVGVLRELMGRPKTQLPAPSGERTER